MSDPNLLRRGALGLASLGTSWMMCVAGAAGATGAAGAPVDDPIPATPTGPFNNAYVIHVALDTTRWTLTGKETVTFRNFGTQPVTEIPFHLYPNAWSSTGTRWVRDARAENAIELRGEAGAAYQRIASVKTADGADVSGASVIDETLMRVTLPAPLAPQAETTLVIEFETRLPLTVARMGRDGDHVDAMQWFPKLCAHVGDRFVDWQFTEPTEFFADFGHYEVSIELPTEYTIEGTGKLLRDEVDEKSGRKTVTFVADAVHDFAWTADPNFIRKVDRSTRGTEIVLLSQPFLEPKSELVLRAARLALDRYDEWFFPYPYERVVIDSLPPGSAGGMEYPTLFTISARAPEFLDAIASRSESPASVTIHEFGHQYWYGLVATNEFEEAWLDEGINTYVTSKILAELFPPHPAADVPRGLPSIARKHVLLPALESGGPLAFVAGYDDSPFQQADLTRPGRRLPSRTLFGFSAPQIVLRGENVDRFRDRMPSYAPVADLTWLTQKSWETYPQQPRTSYTATAYSKPALMLRTLEGLAGFDAVRDLLRAWARRHAFRHPTTADFLALAAEKLPADQVAFLKACIEGRDTVDWAVESARSIEVAPPSGFSPQRKAGDPVTPSFRGLREEPTIVARLKRLVLGAPKDVVERDEAASTEPEQTTQPTQWTSEVVVRNRGRLAVPTTVALVFADGSTESHPVDGTQPWYRIETGPKAARLVSATVDPERKVALDLDLTNGSRLAEDDREVSVTLAAFSQFWVQSLFAGVSWLL